MESIEKLFKSNRDWCDSISQSNPNFFNTLSKGQSPEALWIGCSDSRVPPDTITGMPPGTLFVHRNIANMVVHSDMSLLSVLQYAVEVLKVKHVIVCGHYNCGGVTAAIKGDPHGLIDNWLLHIIDVYLKYEKELSDIYDLPARADRLSELNAYEQVKNLANTPVIKGAWERGRELAVHGFIFDMSTGMLKDLNISIRSFEDIRRVSVPR